MTTTPVLIVGAGPVGLALAIQLARFGVEFRIVDKAPNPSPLNESRALGVHSRTLEVFEDMGVLAAANERGLRWHGLNFYSGGKRVLHVSFDELDAPHPYLLSLPQSLTERILIERLGTLGVKVERNRTFTALEQSPEKVVALVTDDVGGTEAIEARWLVATDGSHSAVRHALEIPFEGSPYEERFIVADLKLHGDLERDESHIWFSPDGPLVCFPLPGERNVRLLAQVDHEVEPTLSVFKELLDRRGPGDKVNIHSPAWLAAFRIHHRIVPRYREGRCFLAGDAAHIHSPVGGQGMNTGIQDAYNLAWKLALVEKGGADLLDSYGAERRPIAEGVLRGTDLATKVVTLRHPVGQEIRNAVARIAGQFEAIQQRIVTQASEIGLHYRKSPIVGGGTPLLGSGPHPGDRAPDFALPSGKRFFEERDGLGHTLLAVGMPAPAIDGVKTLSAPVGPRYGAGLYLVRPDGYVGFRSAEEKALRAFVEKLGVRG